MNSFTRNLFRSVTNIKSMNNCNRYNNTNWLKASESMISNSYIHM